MTPVQKFKIILTLLIVSAIFAGLTAYAYEFPKLFDFNSEKALTEWQEKVFKDKVLYSVEVGPKAALNDGFLLAKSDQACSGLFYQGKFDVVNNPWMSWKWKVDQFPDKTTKGGTAQEGWLEKDDYAARVYVIFTGWNFLKTKSLEYIWDESLPEGTVMTSPYLANIKLMVVHSGNGDLGQWVPEERNIREDFKKAFGTQSPRYATAIALMTDADNTLSTAEASYQDIKVGYKHHEQK